MLKIDHSMRLEKGYLVKWFMFKKKKLNGNSKTFFQFDTKWDEKIELEEPQHTLGSVG